MLAVSAASSPRSRAIDAARLALELGARAVIGALFLYAAAGKLGDRASLAVAIENYHVLPAGASGVLALVLPTIEIAIGASLLSGALGRGASALAAGLLVVFAIAMFSALVRGIELSCGCFGAESVTVTPWTVARNLGLAALATVPLWTGITPWRSALRRHR